MTAGLAGAGGAMHTAILVLQGGTILSPDTLVPASLTVALLSAAIGVTIKVTLRFARQDEQLRRAKRELRKIKRHVGLDIDEDDEW